LKTFDDFQNIKINIVFLLNILLFYTQIKSLLDINIGFVVNFICLYMRKQIIMYRYNKVDIIKARVLK